MKVIYRDHEIDVRREQSLGGDELLYYSVFRVADGFECTSGFEDSAETVETFAAYLRSRVDVELTEADPWMEHAP